MSYTGQVAELPLGPDGLTGSKNLSQVRPTQLLKANAITYENGTLQKEPGTALYTPSAIDSGAAIQGGWDWWPLTGVQRSVVVTGSGKALKDDGSGAYGTTLANGLTVASVVPVFVEGGKEDAAGDRKLFLFTGKNQVKVLAADGATMPSIATPPADWAAGSFPKTGVNHEGRLWGFMGHLAYYSRTSDHEDFVGAGSGTVAVYPGEGEEIACSFVFGSYIIVGKQPAGWYLIDTSDPSVANWKVQRLTRQIGAAGPLAYAVVDGDAIVVDVSGELFLLSTVTVPTDVRPSSLTEDAVFSPFLRENTGPAQYFKIQGIYYPGKRQVWFAIAGFGSSINNARIKLDFNGKPRFAFSSFVTCESLWLAKDANNIPRPVAGDNTGLVRTLDQPGRLHDGAGYQGEFQTAHASAGQLFGDPRLGVKNMNGDFLELVFEPVGEWDLSVTYFWDGVEEETLQFGMGAAGGCVLGTWELGTDKLGGDQVKNLKQRITGNGRRFSLLARNNGAGQDFSIASAYLYARIGDERIPEVA
jgi:hypothetical protein